PNTPGASAAHNFPANPGEFTRTGDAEIAGWTQSDYRVFFVARFDKPIVAAGDNWLKFAPGQTVTMRVGISFVDEDGARRNLDAEAPAAVTFDRMRAHAYEGWNRELQRIRVAGGPSAVKRAFYTAFS